MTKKPTPTALNRIVRLAVAGAKPEWSDVEIDAATQGVMSRAEQPYTDETIDIAITEQVLHDECAEAIDTLAYYASRLHGIAPKGSVMHQFAEHVLDSYEEPLQSIVLEYEQRCAAARVAQA